MSDSDLKLAIFLQKQFDDESQLDNHNDTLIAINLQEEFNQENKSETGMGLSYKTNERNKKNDGKSLVDPSWELVDPTPNIHNLFVVFNERFFWNALQMVCVSWSKRMTMCAGICSYQGRGGLCHITLSEPLLKLRPRKDLVETLLHEMIHAFLFVTNNNRDRDGHGPEFHKHMYRINNEAGTNITVYHDFHDEVELYKQHWWKCGGPCQHRGPYFGIVKRAVNRAPGPNDCWWSQHQQRCGGIFTKIREPEKKKPPQQKSIQTSSSIPNYDIKKFITTSNTPTKSPSKPTKPNKPTTISPNRDIRTFFTPKNPLPASNIQNKPINTIKPKNESNPETGAVFNNGNIHGFKNLGTNLSKKLNNTNSKGFVGVKSNKSGTIVLTGKENSKNLSNPKETTLNKNIQVFSGTRKTLSSTPTSSDDYNKVREAWEKKYNNNNKLLNNKRPATDEINSSQSKKHQKTEIVLIDDDASLNLVTCPICIQKMSSSVIENHINECLVKQYKEDKPEEKQETCCVCNKNMPKSIYKEHIVDCFNTSYENGLDQLVECAICDSFFDKAIIEKHTIDCFEKNCKVDFPQNSNKNSEISNNNPAGKNNLRKCSVCSVLIESSKYESHVEKCLHKMLDDIEDKYDIPTTNTKVNCLVCRKEILKSDLNAHLDECMSGVFDEKLPDGSPKESDKENVKPSCSKDHDDDDFMYNCPFCMNLYSELDMSGHMNECLKSGKDDLEKSVLIDSFSSDEF